MFSGGGKSETSNGRYNVLLLGGDAGTGREGLRPDTMIVAAISRPNRTGGAVQPAAQPAVGAVPELLAAQEAVPDGYLIARTSPAC